jgi:hypothetical protein
VVGDPSERRYIVLALLEVTYFVNAAGLFFLSAILEKRALGNLLTDLTIVCLLACFFLSSSCSFD